MLSDNKKELMWKRQQGDVMAAVKGDLPDIKLQPVQTPQD